MTADDYLGRDISGEEIDGKSLAARRLLGIDAELMPNVFFAVEATLPSLIPQFALIPTDRSELSGNRALARMSPPAILMREDIYTNGNRDCQARFTLAHELGHVLLHRELPRSLKDGLQERKLILNSENQSSEAQADRFAVGFLLPKHIAVRLGSLEAIIENCRVPYFVAEMALKNYGLRFARRLLPYERQAEEAD